MTEAAGGVFTPNGEPDIVIIVTCSITSAAGAKTRKIIRRTRRESPAAVIAACGCGVEELSLNEAGSLGADIIIGNRIKHRIPEILERYFSEGRFKNEPQDKKNELLIVKASAGESEEWDALSLDRPRIRTRAFIKIQDGCSRRCSYCVVPRVRGKETSRSARAVAEEAARVAASGCREVILTGIHLGGYNDYEKNTLAALVRLLSRVKGLSRLRLGSLEPFALSEDLLRALAESEIFCPHLHLPLQSGDDEVLSRMRRGYDARAFLRNAERVRRALGDMTHISTDLIVGFPGETDAAFENSLKVMEEAGIGRAHIFPFSARQGTDAASMGGIVPPPVIKERARLAGTSANESLSRYARRFVGEKDAVLAEETGERFLSGWTRHYLRCVTEKGECDNIGNEISVWPEAEKRGVLLGGGVSPEAADAFDNDS
ncbi:2-methylthioadenine synthetase [Synergistales bacterium]|nr:2-methylthioadenine synthetase [Synergistales bacterium]